MARIEAINTLKVLVNLLLSSPKNRLKALPIKVLYTELILLKTNELYYILDALDVLYNSMALL